MIRFLLPVVIFVIMLGFLYVGLELEPRKIPSALIDKPVPEFVATSVTDESVTVTHNDLKGKVALLNVWATWCPSCKLEHHVLLKIAETGVLPVYGLTYKDERAKAIQWLERKGDPYALNVFDESGRIGIDFGVYGTPETFVIDTDGVIKYKHIGPIDWVTWQDKILPLVKELQNASS